MTASARFLAAHAAARLADAVVAYRTRFVTALKSVCAAAKQTIKNVMSATLEFIAPAFTASTKSQKFAVTAEAQNGRIVWSINGHIGTYAQVPSPLGLRTALRFDAAAIKALTGATVQGGAYIALNRAATAADKAYIAAAAPAATEEDKDAARAFAEAARTGRRVALRFAGQRGGIGNTCDVTTYAMPDGSWKEFSASHE